MNLPNGNAPGMKARGVESNSAIGKLRGKRTTGSRRVPSNWRDRTPDPSDYYGAHLENLTRPDPAGWAHADCPFCSASGLLGVDLAGRKGVWRCARCEAKGDMVSFHQRRQSLGFVSAVEELIRWRVPARIGTPAAVESMREIREILSGASP